MSAVPVIYCENILCHPMYWPWILGVPCGCHVHKALRVPSCAETLSLLFHWGFSHSDPSAWQLPSASTWSGHTYRLCIHRDEHGVTCWCACPPRCLVPHSKVGMAPGSSWACPEPGTELSTGGPWQTSREATPACVAEPGATHVFTVDISLTGAAEQLPSQEVPIVLQEGQEKFILWPLSKLVVQM